MRLVQLYSCISRTPHGFFGKKNRSMKDETEHRLKIRLIIYVVLWELLYLSAGAFSILLVTVHREWDLKFIPVWVAILVWTISIVVDVVYSVRVKQLPPAHGHYRFHRTTLDIVFEVFFYIGVVIFIAFLQNYLVHIYSHHHDDRERHHFGSLLDPMIVFLPLLIVLVLIFFVGFFHYYVRSPQQLLYEQQQLNSPTISPSTTPLNVPIKKSGGSRFSRAASSSSKPVDLSINRDVLF